MWAVANRNLVILGSIVTLVFSVLAALVPRLAYVLIIAQLGGSATPHISYPPFDFSIHVYTLRFAVAAFAGILGLFSMIGPQSRRRNLILLSIVFGSSAFWIPPVTNTIAVVDWMDIYLPWLGGLPVLLGISLIFLGTIMKKTNVPRFTLLSVPLLFGSYSAYPLMITSSNFWLLRNYSSQTIIAFWAILLLYALGQALMFWGAGKAIKIHVEKGLKQNETQPMEKPV